MLDQLQRQGLALSWKTGNDTMEGNGSDPHQEGATVCPNDLAEGSRLSIEQ